MKKTYGDFVDEISADELYQGLLPFTRCHFRE